MAACNQTKAGENHRCAGFAKGDERHDRDFAGDGVPIEVTEALDAAAASDGTRRRIAAKRIGD